MCDVKLTTKFANLENSLQDRGNFSVGVNMLTHVQSRHHGLKSSLSLSVTRQRWRVWFGIHRGSFVVHKQTLHAPLWWDRVVLVYCMRLVCVACSVCDVNFEIFLIVGSETGRNVRFHYISLLNTGLVGNSVISHLPNLSKAEDESRTEEHVLLLSFCRNKSQ